MILIVIPIVIIISIVGFTYLSMTFFEKRHFKIATEAICTVLFSFLGVILSITLVVGVPARLAEKYCDYTPVYSHSKTIYDLYGDYITDSEDNYIIYVKSSDSNNIYERYLPKENTNIIDIETETPHINYYSPKFKNKLVDFYFNQAFTIDKYDIYI